MSYTFGIDPGCSGAIVMMEGGKPIEWMLMPTYKEGSNTRVNAFALAQWIDKCSESYIGHGHHAYVELVHSMPAQGVASSFSFGHAAGVVMGVLGAFEIPTTLVTPQTWKKRAGLIGTDKDAARSRAIGLWPSWSELGLKGKGQALADAALIATYGESK
jgi:crossover junction endodeoxyribonuclease RuvC